MTKHRHARGCYVGPKGEARKTAILDALKLAVATFSWRAVNISWITREAGCSTALFYDYYPDLESAFDDLWVREIRSVNGGKTMRHMVIVHDLLEYERSVRLEGAKAVRA